MHDIAKTVNISHSSDNLAANSKAISQTFPQESWEQDQRDRFAIAPLRQLFYRAVPALRFLNWQIEEINRGYAVTRLPLNVESSNQYITQQAALMLLAADYTGGIALSTLFKDAPVIGFHPQKTDFGAYLWGAAATIKWLRPSTDDLILRSTIPQRDWDGIAAAFADGKEVNYKARIKLYSARKLCGVCDFQYWARNSHALAATGAKLKTTHHMFAHKIKTSARLIAGLRADLSLDGNLIDPYAMAAAGPQGIAMAKKFSLDTPQLRALVLARTLNCDGALRHFARLNERFTVVNIGSGYDARPWRMSGLGDVTFIHLDLPVMRQHSETVLPTSAPSSYRLLRKDFDINTDNLGAAILSAGGCLKEPMFFIWEGGSMYFHPVLAETLFFQIRQLMSDTGELWFDCVSSTAVENCTGHAEVEAFVDSMRMVGEPFVRGFSEIQQDLSAVGFQSIKRSTAAQVLNDFADPVLQHYSFVTCKRV